MFMCTTAGIDHTQSVLYQLKFTFRKALHESSQRSLNAFTYIALMSNWVKLAETTLCKHKG